MSAPRIPDKPYPQGGNKTDRPTAILYTNKRGSHRARFTLTYEDAMAIAVGDHLTTQRLLYMIRETVELSEAGLWRVPKWKQRTPKIKADKAAFKNRIEEEKHGQLTDQN